MKKSVIFIFTALITLFFTLGNQAQLFSSDKEEIIFAPNRINKEVTWSKGFFLKATGLETEMISANSGQDIWIQTHAFPIAMSWRPPESASFRIYFDGSIKEIDPNLPSAPRIFIRYSCDKVNWSTWYQTNTNDKATETESKIYKANISLPQAASEKYENLKREWWKTNPVWSSDEHEYCEWLIKKEPDFFAQEFPFIGYVQVRLEKISINTSQTIKSLTVEFNSMVSGLSSPPKDKTKARKNSEDKWFFIGRKNIKELMFTTRDINESMFSYLF